MKLRRRFEHLRSQSRNLSHSDPRPAILEDSVAVCKCRGAPAPADTGTYVYPTAWPNR
jgi:hypothetical protein